MNRESDECCGLCARFTRKEESQTEIGNGWCSGFEKFVHCTDRPEVLFNLAAREQLPERRAFIELHKEETK